VKLRRLFAAFLSLAAGLSVALAEQRQVIVPPVPSGVSYQITIDRLPANGGTIRISNANNVVIKELFFQPGERLKRWDRSNTTGQVVPVGFYTVEIIAS
jgi:flagellar hook assembly protein FlgD